MKDWSQAAFCFTSFNQNHSAAYKTGRKKKRRGKDRCQIAHHWQLKYHLSSNKKDYESDSIHITHSKLKETKSTNQMYLPTWNNYKMKPQIKIVTIIHYLFNLSFLRNYFHFT